MSLVMQWVNHSEPTWDKYGMCLHVLYLQNSLKFQISDPKRIAMAQKGTMSWSKEFYLLLLLLDLQTYLISTAGVS